MEGKGGGEGREGEARIMRDGQAGLGHPPRERGGGVTTKKHV